MIRSGLGRVVPVIRTGRLPKFPRLRKSWKLSGLGREVPAIPAAKTQANREHRRSTQANLTEDPGSAPATTAGEIVCSRHRIEDNGDKCRYAVDSAAFL